MSSVRGGGARGRGRNNGPRLPSTNRGASSRGSAQRDNVAARGAANGASQQSVKKASRRAGNIPTTNGFAQQPAGNAFGGARSTGSWQDRYQALTKARERERANAIVQGLIADPDKPRSLSEAITPVGTCQEMCAEFERVERVVVKDVWAEETDPNHSVYSTVDREPDEARMVKKFRRAAAGLEEQLPSDLRPPPVLKRTCDYLFNEVVGNATTLEQVHHFVWDRTRAIRNDFSIQQISRPEDLSVAIECYERIARFHISSLHQLAVHPKPYDKYDAQQEREQLDRTLLSLMQCYDDSRGKIQLSNEAEFRAYCLIFQMQDPTPDLEDRVQTWPGHVVQDTRVQTALQLYAAACYTMDPQGPLKPRANHLIAQQDWEHFWTLLASKRVSYLMGCVAEIYFNLVRRTALSALLRAFKPNPNKAEQDWTPDVLCNVLGFDDHDKVYTFCEAYGFSFADRQDGEQYLDLTSVKERSLPQPDVNLPRQWKSELVESKRFGRTLPAIINGLSVKQAQDAGMVAEAEENDDEMNDVVTNENDTRPNKAGPFIESSSDPNDEESLFLPEIQQQKNENTDLFNFKPPSSTLGTPQDKDASGSTSNSGFTWGKPSSDGPGTVPNGGSIFNFKPADSAKASGSSSGFNFLSGSAPAPAKPTEPATVPPSGFAFDLPKFEPGKFSFTGKPSADSKDSAKSQETSPFFRPNPSQQGDSSASPAIPASPSQAPPPISQPSTGLFNDSSKASSSMTAEYKSATATADVMPPPAEKFVSPDQLPQTATPLQTRPETSPSQPHFTAANPSPPPSPTSATATNSHRKSSLPDTRPKKPSPLSNSFNADGDYTTAATSDNPNKSLGKQPLPNAFSPPTVQNTLSAAAAPRPPERTITTEAPKENFRSLVKRLAEEIANDDHSGLIKQFLDFTVQQVITSVQADLGLEALIIEADNFRRKALANRYGKRWRDRYWSKRLAARGRARRERARKGLEDHKRSVLLGSAGELEKSIFEKSSSKIAINKMSRSGDYRMTSGTSRDGPRATHWDQHADTGTKRPSSSQGPEKAMTGGEPGHKRLKSTSHVDDHRHVNTSALSTSPTTDLLKRSSFLGFSLANEAASRGSTTRSNYFRLKAIGIEPAHEVTELRGTKRKQSAPGEERAERPYAGLDMSQLLKSRTESPRDATPKRPSPLPVKSNDADEALFARLAAARASLAESTTFIRSEMAMEKEHQNSVSSHSSGESPSMARARAEARWRASNGLSASNLSTTGGNVPAYRLRESKFVPREQYGLAIARAREIRESRSRETSRPESRTDLVAADFENGSPDLERQFQKNGATLQQGSIEEQVRAMKTPNGVPSKPNQHPHAPNSAASANVPSGFFGFAPQSTFGEASRANPSTVQHDFTVQPAQVDNSLRNSFGASSGQLQLQSKDGEATKPMPSQPDTYSYQHGFSFSPVEGGSQMSPTPMQSNSYMHSQAASEAISLLSEDEDDDQPAYAHRSTQQSGINGTEAGAYGVEALEDGDEILDPSTEDDAEVSYKSTDFNAALAVESHAPEDKGAQERRDKEMFNRHADNEMTSYGHVNPYAALANDEDDEKDSAEESDDGEQFARDADAGSVEDGYEDGGDDEPQASHYYDQNGYFEDEDLDGDVEDAEDYDDEEGIDEDEEKNGAYSVHQHYSDEEAESEDDDPEASARMWQARPAAADSALQEVGGTVEEAIELSD